MKHLYAFQRYYFASILFYLLTLLVKKIYKNKQFTAMKSQFLICKVELMWPNHAIEILKNYKYHRLFYEKVYDQNSTDSG